jgi:hypothetical protein
MTGSNGEKLYPGTDENSYRSIKELIRTARISGELDDDCFIDNKRVLIPGETDGWSNIAEYMEPLNPRRYTRNRWQDQPNRIQVWVEKDTLRGLIEAPCAKWDVTQFISTGAFSRTFLVRAADRISKFDYGRIYVFYIGDFDPSGLTIEDAAQRGNDKEGNRGTEGLLDILQNRHGWTARQCAESIVWKRIVVTQEDFENSDLAPYRISVKDAGYDEETGKCRKGHDPRAEKYKAKYGDQCLEAEALEVLRDGEIADRLDIAISGAIDMDAWTASKRKQQREIREWLRKHPAKT